MCLPLRVPFSRSSPNSVPLLHIEHRFTNPTQVSPTATEAELKKAYKTNALKYHPGR